MTNGRYAGRRHRYGDSSSACYVEMIRHRLDRHDLETGVDGEAGADWYCRIKRLQFMALDGLDQTERIPRLTEIAALCGIHTDTVRYGVRVFVRGLQEYLGSGGEKAGADTEKEVAAV
jgi:hypothetical protein